MKNLKRVLVLALSLVMMLSIFVSCNSKDENDTTSKTTNKEPVKVDSEEQDTNNSVDGNGSADTVIDDTTIHIGGLKGPTTMGLVKLMQDYESGKSKCNYDFTVEATADVLTPLLIKGELDMVAIPANVASVLYNRTKGNVQVLAINTLGVLYIVERGLSIESVEDLKGKTIYATGKGTTPEFSLRYILAKNGLDADKDVTIVWKTEANEVVAQLANTDGAIAMLPQPYVTVAKTKVSDLEIVLNLNDEWSAADDSTSMVTGVTIVRKEFAKEHPELIQAFLEEYKTSAEYIVANPTEASTWVEAKIGVAAAVAEKAIPYCNIKVITGEEMKVKLSSYLGVLFEQKADSVGGSLPADDFYYGA